MLSHMETVMMCIQSAHYQEMKKDAGWEADGIIEELERLKIVKYIPWIF
jgi:hypothetical protein